ncbi:MAG: TRAP transporter small permease [Myxococcota bacterium]|nr:TRAP transporter small permease [Myxococcota bacterium]
MKHLLNFDRILGRVEGVILSISLLTMLTFALYSVAYRNLVSPLVLRLQGESFGLGEAAPVAPTAPTSAAALPGSLPAATGEAAPDQPAALPAVGSGAAPTDAYLGDLGDEAPAAAPAPAPAPAPAATGAYLGDLGDEAPAAAPAPAPAPAPAATGAYLGDLGDEAPAAAPAPAPAPAPAATGAYLGDLGDEAPAAAPAPAPAPAATGAYLGDLGDEAPAAAPAPAPAPAAPTSEPTLATAALPPPAASVLPEDGPLLALLKWFNFGWIDVVTRHLLLWVAFFGAAYATNKRRYIKIEVLNRLFAPRGRERLTIGLDLIAAAACIFLVQASWRFLVAETASGGTLHGAIPAWVGIGIIPLGFGLLAYHFLFEAVLGIAILFGYDSPELTARREALRGLAEGAP